MGDLSIALVKVAEWEGVLVACLYVNSIATNASSPTEALWLVTQCLTAGSHILDVTSWAFYRDSCGIRRALYLSLVYSVKAPEGSIALNTDSDAKFIGRQPLIVNWAGSGELSLEGSCGRSHMRFFHRRAGYHDLNETILIDILAVRRF